MKNLIKSRYVLLRKYVTSATTTTTTTKSNIKRNKDPIIFSNRNSKNLQLHDFLPKPELNPDVVVLPTQLPYLNTTTNRDVELKLETRKYYVEVYGCQMNVNDTEILMSVMNQAKFILTKDINEADIVFLVTCSIRDSAEQKIWHKLRTLKSMKRPHHPQKLPPTIGVLGCMAERLKGKLLEESKLVDIVCGPDAYRSLPHLLNINETTTQGVANVILSADETYADIVPVRKDEANKSVFVSIMRGCNNMCSYCIVPFTRGIERSRPIQSIVDEVKRLSSEGVKEVVLLGQNVNSYRDTSVFTSAPSINDTNLLSNQGFTTIYKPKQDGLRFTELMSMVADIDPELRIRFTSPHPKDFPEPLLQLIADKPNLCNQLHLPAQSGNTEMLERMRRGYSREAYLELIDTANKIIPGVSISSDFITGFCGETEQEHMDTLTLMDYVQYDMAFMFKYSMREGTHAHRKLNDNVLDDVKQRRLTEIIKAFHKNAQLKLNRLVNKPQLILIDGRPLPKHVKENKLWMGRTDGNHKAFLKLQNEGDKELFDSIQQGDYVTFLPTEASSTSLTGIPLERTTLKDFFNKYGRF